MSTSRHVSLTKANASFVEFDFMHASTGEADRDTLADEFKKATAICQVTGPPVDNVVTGRPHSGGAA